MDQLGASPCSVVPGWLPAVSAPVAVDLIVIPSDELLKPCRNTEQHEQDGYPTNDGFW